MRVSSFFFNDTATTEIYTLALHDALPIFFLWRPLTHARGSLLFQQGGVGDELVGGLYEMVRGRLRDPDHHDLLSPAAEQAHERDKIPIAGYQDVSVHLRMVMQKVRALHGQHHVYQIGRASC